MTDIINNNPISGSNDASITGQEQPKINFDSIDKQLSEVYISRINKYNRDLKDIEFNIDVKNAELNAILDKINSSNTRLNNIINNINTKNAEYRLLQQNIDESNEKIKSLSDNINNLVLIINQHNSTITLLKKDIIELTRELDSKRSEYKAECERLQSEMANSKSELDIIKKRIGILLNREQYINEREIYIEEQFKQLGLPYETFNKIQ